MNDNEKRFIRWANDNCPHPDMEPACRAAWFSALESMTPLEEHRNILQAQMIRLRDALEKNYETSPEGRKELERIEKSINYDVD